MIDTHCHLTFPDFQDGVPPDRTPGGVPAVLAKAASHGVTGCITISTTTIDCLHALALAKQHPNVWCTAGVHPLHSDEGPHEWHNLRIVASDARCVAWGELGLDNHYPNPPRDVQRRVLAEQLAFIESCHRDGPVKPVVIHCREAFADLIPILKRSSLDPSRFVFHCFTGTAQDMRLLLDFGAWVSFTGVITYKNAGALREAATLPPPDRIMVETDAPFLSPDPHRGVRPCQPWMVSVTARALAAARGHGDEAGWEAFHVTLIENTARFFGVR